MFPVNTYSIPEGLKLLKILNWWQKFLYSQTTFLEPTGLRLRTEVQEVVSFLLPAFLS